MISRSTTNKHYFLGLPGFPVLIFFGLLTFPFSQGEIVDWSTISASTCFKICTVISYSEMFRKLQVPIDTKPEFQAIVNKHRYIIRNEIILATDWRSHWPTNISMSYFQGFFASVQNERERYLSLLAYVTYFTASQFFIFQKFHI